MGFMSARSHTSRDERTTIVEAWPEQMRADTAARFCDEPSVDAFRRSVGKLYPRPYRVPGKGDRWSRGDLERALKRLRGEEIDVPDAADLL